MGARALVVLLGLGVARCAISDPVDVPKEANAIHLEGHPVTAVVVTQCNLMVAVYVTLADGRLLRFAKESQIPVEQLVAMAATADRSERVEVGCTEIEAPRFERHDPV